MELSPRPRRLESIDVLRGVVMVLMTLDHCRDYFGDFRVDPTAVPDTTVAFFFTRWSTHFCAPVFVFLAGMAAWLYGAKCQTKARLSRFLWTRGLWLLALEFSVIHLAWCGSFASGVFFFQVIGAIGAVMVALSALVFLPTRIVGCVGLLIIAGHNLADGVLSSDLGRASWVWTLLHESNISSSDPLVPLGKFGSVLVVYPVVPWIGVIALGYGFGPLTQFPQAQRRRRFLAIGVGITILFIVLRALNGYGDPGPWQNYGSASLTALSFLNTQKYPPSLLFALMTLGPAIAMLGLLDRKAGRLGRVLAVFGRVPLFYYILHVALIHASSAVMYKWMYGQAYSAVEDGLLSFFGGPPIPEWYGQPLWAVYLAWGLVVVTLYPACHWYAGVKRRSSSPLLSYL